jgi:LacI family transcriptional regulator
MVGVLIPDVRHRFYTEVMYGISAVLESQGYHMLYHRAGPQSDTYQRQVSAIKAYRPAGSIVVKGTHARSIEDIQDILETGGPVVMLERIEGLETHAVCYDNRRAARMAPDYVFDMGHRRVTYLAGSAPWGASKERKLGFMESLVEHELDFDGSMTMEISEPVTEGGYEAALKVLSDPETRPTALLCFNDLAAMGVYRAAYELGLRIPDDVSVIGFDGIEYCEVLAPPLTTVSIFPEQLGKAAADLLLEVIQRDNRGGLLTREIEPKLIERQSVRRL